MVIDETVLESYDAYYFSIHTRARKRPIPYPYHESINKWMIMKRPMMNALKQKWKSFMVWFIQNQGYANLHIQYCEIQFDSFYATRTRHDTDNSCPKFIIDGLCEAGFLEDDDYKHLGSLTLKCHVDPLRPRTEITVWQYDENERENDNGEQEVQL